MIFSYNERNWEMIICVIWSWDQNGQLYPSPPQLQVFHLAFSLVDSQKENVVRGESSTTKVEEPPWNIIPGSLFDWQGRVARSNQCTVSAAPSAMRPQLLSPRGFRQPSPPPAPEPLRSCYFPSGEAFATCCYLPWCYTTTTGVLYVENTLWNPGNVSSVVSVEGEPGPIIWGQVDLAVHWGIYCVYFDSPLVLLVFDCPILLIHTWSLSCFYSLCLRPSDSSVRE